MRYKSDHARIVDLEEYVARLQLKVARIIEYNGLAVKPKLNLPENTCDTADPVPKTLQLPAFAGGYLTGAGEKPPEITVTINCPVNKLRNPREIS